MNFIWVTYTCTSEGSFARVGTTQCLYHWEKNLSSFHISHSLDVNPQEVSSSMNTSVLHGRASQSQDFYRSSMATLSLRLPEPHSSGRYHSTALQPILWPLPSILILFLQCSPGFSESNRAFGSSIGAFKEVNDSGEVNP